MDVSQYFTRAGFNPRSHVGSDLPPLSSRNAPEGFNPRSHVGSDVYDRPVGNHSVVSIHAPTWGATDIHIFCNLINICFNPRSHVGSDFFQQTFKFISVCFNPRSHVGSDCPTRCHNNNHKGFNPRSHVGSDTLAVKQFHIRIVSIHAPTWGATFRGIHQPPIYRGFNPRSHVGSDFLTQFTDAPTQGFNPRSHVGSDL